MMTISVVLTHVQDIFGAYKCRSLNQLEVQTYIDQTRQRKPELS